MPENAPNTVSWTLHLDVREGQLENARALMPEMVAGTQQEKGALGYEWFLSEDGKTCHLYERYADSEAGLVHVGNFGTHFAERFFGCFEPTSFCFYGEPSAELKAALDGFGVAFFRWFGGFHR